MTEHRTC